jgi:hypothetical protein
MLKQTRTRWIGPGLLCLAIVAVAVEGFLLFTRGAPVRHDQRFIYASPRRQFPAELTMSATEARQFRNRWRLVGSVAANRPSDLSRPVIHSRTKIGTSEWAILTYKTSEGLRCAAIHAGAEGTFIGCGSSIRPATATHAFVQPGAQQFPGSSTKRSWDLSWVWGLAEPDVAIVKIVLTDCTSLLARPDRDHVFLSFVTPTLTRRGATPAEVVTLRRDNSIIGRGRLLSLGDPANTSKHRLAPKCIRRSGTEGGSR